MHFKSVALLALASVAIASPNADIAKRAVSLNPTEISVEAVLATALPPSLLSIGFTNPAALGAIIASSFSAGETPAWYSALPSDVKSYLPVLYAAVTSTVAAPSSTAAPSSASAATTAALVTVISTPGATGASGMATLLPSGNSTVASTVRSATLTTTMTTGGSKSSGAAASSGASSAASKASTASTGGASYPTAVMGAGIAGALGFLGMLAM